MSIQKRRFLDNCNRLLVLALTLVALLMDGYGHEDVPAVLALLIWLWLSVCTRVEVTILDRAWRDGRSSPIQAIRATLSRRKL